MVSRSGPLRVGLISEDVYLAEQVARLADSAGVVLVGPGGEPPDVWLRDVGAGPLTEPGIGGAPVLGVPRRTPGPATSGRPGRGSPGDGGPPVLLIRAGTTSRPPVRGWSPGAGRVLELPADAVPLLRHLSALAYVPRARTIGVVGARGGAGASTLGAALARAGVRGGVCTALADLDGAGGGLDLLLGIEHEPGPRWADLRAERGGFPARALSVALPQWHAVRVLSGDLRGGARPGDPGVVDAVRALISEHDLVVLDLPRGWLGAGVSGEEEDPGGVQGPGDGEDRPESVVGECEVVLVVATCDVRSAAAAVVAARALADVDARLVVRGPAPGGLAPEEVSRASGLPLAARMSSERGSAAAAERGEAPGDHRRGTIARTAQRLLVDLAVLP